jgi:hypothetical protein
MRTRLSILCLAFTLASCDSATGSGDGFDPNDYVGNWTLHIAAAANCWPAFDLVFLIPQEAASASDPDVFNIVESEGWWFASVPANRFTYSGHINSPGEGNDFDIRFWKANSSVHQGHFVGASHSRSSMSGTFTDPDQAFRGTLYSGWCEATATATH